MCVGQDIRLLVCSFLLLMFGMPCASFAQELEPRRWSHLPTGANFIGLGYAYTTADISDAPAFRLEDVQAELQSWVARYIRTFELLGNSARAEITQGYQKGHWEGLLDGTPASTRRAGWTDTIARVALNIYGAPPLTGREFAAYRARHDVETIVGIALAVHLPTGEYESERLINLGSNRFTFRPQIGVVHERGNWSFELTGAAWIYTDNDEFLGGSKLEQEPLLTAQGHISYTFRPGLWIDVASGYSHGAQSTVNGSSKDDRKQNVAWALTIGYPITRHWGVKLNYVGLRKRAREGSDQDSISVAISHLW